MATAYTQNITNQFSTPTVINDAYPVKGSFYSLVETWEFAADSTGDKTIVFKVPVDVIPVNLHFAHDALTDGAANIGLYKYDSGSSTSDVVFSAVDEDLFASAVSLTNAAGPTRVLFEAAATNIDKATSKLWEWAGLNEKPDYDSFYIVITKSTGSSAGGTGYLKFDYVNP